MRRRNRLEGAGHARSVGKEPRAGLLELLNAPNLAGGAQCFSKVEAPEHKTVLPAISFTHPRQQRRAAQLCFGTDDWKYWASHLHTQIQVMKSTDPKQRRLGLPFRSLSSSPCITQRGWKELLSSYSGPFNLKNWTKMKYIQKNQIKKCPCFQLVNWPWGEHVAFLKPGFLTYKMRMKNYFINCLSHRIISRTKEILPSSPVPWCGNRQAWTGSWFYSC